MNGLLEQEKKKNSYEHDVSELINTKRCIFCKSENLKIKKAGFVPFLNERMFQFKPKHTSFVHCNKCGINYSSYRPNDEEMTRLYSGYRDEFYQKQRQKYEDYYTEEFNYNLGHNENDMIYRKNFISSVIKKHLNPYKFECVLDYGGDNGQFIPECFEKARKYVYEISNVKPIEGVESISDKEALKPLKPDFVMCCHVLEHVSYPIEIIKELIDVCADNGYIYIEVPDEKIVFNGGYIHEHITVYSPKTFMKLWDLFENVNVIENKDVRGRIYVLLKKEHINPIYKLLKTIYFSFSPNIEQITKTMKKLRAIAVLR